MFPEKHLQALLFIINFFKENNIPYVLTGGAAANLYGSGREIIDLDFDVPNEMLPFIAESLKEYVISGPKRHVEDVFDVMLLRLKYGDVPIDLGGAGDYKILDRNSRAWVLDTTDLTRFNEIDVQGTNVRVVPLEDLLAYKNKLRRPVDLQDINALERR